MVQPMHATTNQQHQTHLHASQQQLQDQAATSATWHIQPPLPGGIVPSVTLDNINTTFQSPMAQNAQLSRDIAQPSPLSGNSLQTSWSPMPPAQRPDAVTGQQPRQPTTVQQMHEPTSTEHQPPKQVGSRLQQMRDTHQGKQCMPHRHPTLSS